MGNPHGLIGVKAELRGLFASFDVDRSGKLSYREVSPQPLFQKDRTLTLIP